MAAAKAAGAAASPAAPAYSTPDQPARFAAQKAADNSRALRIEEHFQPGRLAGARVLVTGANRGLGLALVREAVACGARVVATCRKPSPELQAAGCAQIVEGIDVAVDASRQVFVDLVNTVRWKGKMRTRRHVHLQPPWDIPLLQAFLQCLCISCV